MCLTEYDEKQHMEAVRAEGKEEGREEGREQINALYSILLQEGRLDDLKKSINDKDFQNTLLEEYKL